MNHRLPHHVVKWLTEVIEYAKLTNASFDGVGQGDALSVTVKTEVREGTFAGTVTDFIRERVKLHHDTWIIGGVQQVLDWSENPESDYRIGEGTDVLSRLNSPFPHPDVLKDAADEITRLRKENDRLNSFRRSVMHAVEHENRGAGNAS